MDYIIEPNETFDFSKCALLNPIAMQGSSYFTRVQYNGNNMYIQTPKCLTKQGIVKNNKKMYIELMFDNSHESFISWLENLETTFQNLIYEKNDSWFQNPLEKVDIESSFVSPIKVYKSGKNYLVRVPIKVNVNSLTPIVKIYNENTDELCVEDIHEDSYVICIIEILGIRFTTRNFQIDMEVKQMMSLNQDKFMNNCLIKKKDHVSESSMATSMATSNATASIIVNTDTTSSSSSDYSLFQEKEKEKVLETENFSNDFMEPSKFNEIKEHIEEKEKDELKKSEDNEVKEENEEKVVEKVENEVKEENIETESLDVDELFTTGEEIKEVNFSNTLDHLETITLKNPNEVFYEIYKKAKEKARLAKREALRAVLEAKNIKKTYMLDDNSDEDDDSVSDFDEYEELEEGK